MYDRDPIRTFAIGVVCLSVGIIVGAGFVWWMDQRTIGERDSRIGELGNANNELGANLDRVREQIGRIAEPIHNIGVGISEAQTLTARAREQSLGVTATVKKLIAYLTGIQVPIGTLENNYYSILRDYNSLRGSVGLPPLDPVIPPEGPQSE